MAKRRPTWDADGVKSLRQHLGMTQQEMARELGTRQQTISEWETSLYRPRGLSERLLSLVAERAGFAYDAWADAGGNQPAEGAGAGPAETTLAGDA